MDLSEPARWGHTGQGQLGGVANRADVNRDPKWTLLLKRADSRRAPVAALTIGLLLSACASTARQPIAETSFPGGPSEASSHPDAVAARTGESDTMAVGGARQAPGGVTGSAGAAPYGEPAAHGVVAHDTVVGSSGPGVTATTITIGIAWSRDLDEGAEDLRRVTGVRITPPDLPGVLRQVARDVNERGGIAGRRLRVEVWRYDEDDYPTPADYVEAECAHFTQDVPVFSVFTWKGDIATYHCYEDHGMPFVETWAYSLDDVELRRLQHTYSTSFPNLSRLARLNAAGLANEGFLTPDSKIGVVTYDHPVFVRPVEQVLKPVLAARGLSLAGEARINVHDLGVAATEVNNAVLRFRRDGIDKVLFLETSTELALLFTRAAEAQQHHGFRYGLTSASSPDVRDKGGVRWLPAGQMTGAVSLGWAPLGDIPQGQGLALLGQPAKRCLEIIERDGVRYDRDSCCELWSALEICERVWFIDAAIEAGYSGAVSATSFLLGAESLGSTFDAPTTPRLTFEPGKHDGPSTYRVARWMPSCSCFSYTSRPRPMP